MISIVITAFKEPKTIGKAIESIINQRISSKYELIVAAPDKKTSNIIKKYEKKYKSVKYFKDPGKGKSHALNLIFKKLKGDILIFTDGDVYLGKNAISEITRKFKNKKVGVVSGRPVPQDSRDTMLGYWSWLLFEAGAHAQRLKQSKIGFLECSGYLFAFRNGIINKIPLDVAEDSVIPYMFYEKGYKIDYAPKAEVYVKNPDTFGDWIKQRRRTAKAHETLSKYVDVSKVPRMKSFFNEVKEGSFRALRYPKTLKEMFWTIELFTARLILWMLVFYDTKFRRKSYSDNWERVESTK